VALVIRQTIRESNIGGFICLHAEPSQQELCNSTFSLYTSFRRATVDDTKINLVCMFLLFSCGTALLFFLWHILHFFSFCLSPSSFSFCFCKQSSFLLFLFECFFRHECLFDWSSAAVINQTDADLFTTNFASNSCFKRVSVTIGFS